MIQNFLKMFKNSNPRKVVIGKNTYTCPSGNDGYKGGHNSDPVPPRPPKPKFFFEKEDTSKPPHPPAIPQSNERYFEGCGWYLPATEGLSYKGGINEGPSGPRPPPPTLTHKEKTPPPSEDHSIADMKIPLSPELVKDITEVIEENYQSKWKDGYPLGEIENLYKEFQIYRQTFSKTPPWGPIRLPQKMEDFLDRLDWGIRQLLGNPVTISYKEYKALKDLLSELYKSTAIMYSCRSPIKPYSDKDMIETVSEHLMIEWEDKTTNKK